MDRGSTAFGTAQDVPGRPAYVSRQEAIEVLGVKPQTLYSYVSRGLVRRCVDRSGRSSAYNFQDIQRLKARSLARSGHGPAAANAIHWGEPVLLTAITKITERGPLYGEHLAIDLARRHHRFESVADYLWTGIGPADDVIWREGRHAGLGRQLDEIIRFHPNVHIRQLLTEVALLLGMEEADGARRARSDTEQARDLMQAMAGAFGFLGPRRRYLPPRRGDTIARVLARALGLPTNSDVAHALDGVLVVVADHEFTPATFAARIAASAGNDLYSCVGAALQVHFGSALGLRCDLLEQCPGGPPSPETARAAAAVSMPHALDHPLYRHGDPRADALVEIAEPLASRSRARNRGSAAVMPREQRTQSMDHALVAVCQALGAPRYAAGALLAFGRMAGWIAHVFEQRREQFVIRPRAKFVSRSELGGAPPMTPSAAGP
jgi:citrate synthase